MTTGPRNLPYLRLVDSNDERDKENVDAQSKRPRSQISLFSDASEESLGFVEASRLEATTFQHLLEDVKPKVIFDLRRIPNFSFGSLTRQTVFALFETYSVRYFDVAGALGVKSNRDAALNPKLLVPNLLANVLRSDRPLSGPVLFFVDGEHLTEEFIEGIEHELPQLSGKGWEVSVWEAPSREKPEKDDRPLIFISHANPEDNAVAQWLSTRLAIEGYNVWSDITRLIGGEVFWDSIEEIIREKAACVIVLLSKEGHEKPGVLDEVNVAVATERRYSLRNFVIPVRVDKLPFSSIRANLARKNIIDGSENLASALNELLSALEQINVPRVTSKASETLSAWRTQAVDTRQLHDQEQWNCLVENSIAVIRWPTAVRRFVTSDFSYEHVSPLVRDRLAIAPGPRGHFTFASAEELKKSLSLNRYPECSGEALVSSVVSGDASGIFRCDQRDLMNVVTSLVRQSWESACRAKGLDEYRLANNKVCFFCRKGFAPKNEVRFLDRMGKTRRRALVGRSEKRGVFWHFGVEAHFVVSAGIIRLRPHVVFSEDGATPIESPSKQHSLRRSFCRNWWNDRWRDLLIAFTKHLSDGEDVWSLPVSTDQSLDVSGNLGILDARESEGGATEVLPEPQVAVGMQQVVEDPRKGLMLFGPVAFERNPSTVRVGLVSTVEGSELFNLWCAAFRKPAPMSKTSRQTGEVPFPGFEAVYGSTWPEKPIVECRVSRTDMLNAIRGRDRHQAIYSTVDLVVHQIRKAIEEDDAQVDIWFIVIPEEVYIYGRPNSRVPSTISITPKTRLNKRIAKRFLGDAPSLFPEDNEEAKIYEYHADFHHQLKARLLKFRAVTQIMRESSLMHSLDFDSTSEQASDDEDIDLDIYDELSVGRRMQDPLNVHWNLSTACFFKSGGRPWRVITARPGVCYVGLIFKRDELRGQGNACCGAQLFLDSGEGLVFKGAMGPWYSNETKQFHLPKEEAKSLMERVLSAYKEIHGIFPSEVFVHGRTRFSRDETTGFEEAGFGKSKVTGVRITRTSEVKLFSSGDMPVKRGTVLKLSERVGLIWTSGYIDALGTYQGRETPNPLRVEVCGSCQSDLDTILNDILTLTKMNFNSSVFADGFPVTMRFAEAIGDVLMATGTREIPPLPFRHYI